MNHDINVKKMRLNCFRQFILQVLFPKKTQRFGNKRIKYLFSVIGNKNNHSRRRDLFLETGKSNAAKFRHINIEKKSIIGNLLQFGF